MRRLLAASAVAGIAAAAVGPLMPRVSFASICPQPSVSEIDVNGVPQQHGPVGANVVLKGSNFSAFGCSDQVFIGGNQVSNPSVNSGTQQISFTLSSAWSGTLTVQLTDSANSSITDSTQRIFVTDPSVSSNNPLNPSAPATGTTVTFNGSNFAFNIPPSLPQETYSASYTWTGSNSGTCSPPTTPQFASPSQLKVVMPSQYCQGNVNVTMTAPCGPNQLVCSGGASSTMSLPPVSAPFDIAASVSSAPGGGTAGSSASINGSGFGSSTGTVTIGGSSVPVSSWSDTSIRFTVPDGATNGQLQVVRAYDGATIVNKAFGVSATITGVSPAKAAVGDTVTITGSGFGTQGTVTVNSTSATVSSWSPSSINFIVPAGATTGPVVVSPNSTTAPGSNPTLTVIPKITGITPTHAAPGALIEIDGTTFGTQQGTVSIGSASAQVTLWGDQEVLAMVPSLPKGGTTVSVHPPGNDAATAPFSVDSPPPPPSSGPSGGGGGSGSSNNGSHGSTPGATPGFIAPNPSGPVIVHGPVPFFKPAPPPGPVSLRLSSAAGQADPGGSVKFTVTLMAFGKPIAGAPVDLLMVIEPGADATLDPTHAVTDANGKVEGVIHLSKTPGDHIVLARSGIYSDEIRLVGRSAANTVASAGTSGGSSGPSGVLPPLLAVRSPVLWALVACLLLFGVGFGLNLMTSPAVAGGPAVANDRRRGMGFGEAVIGSAATVGAALRFGAGVVAVLSAQIVGRFRGA